MQLPQGRSEESKRNVCSPIGLDQSLRVPPKSATVGIPDIHAICIRPESSDNISVVCCNIENASREVVCSARLMSLFPNCPCKKAAFEVMKEVPKTRNFAFGNSRDHN